MAPAKRNCGLRNEVVAPVGVPACVLPHRNRSKEQHRENDEIALLFENEGHVIVFVALCRRRMTLRLTHVHGILQPELTHYCEPGQLTSSIRILNINREDFPSIKLQLFETLWKR